MKPHHTFDCNKVTYQHYQGVKPLSHVKWDQRYEVYLGVEPLPHVEKHFFNFRRERLQELRKMLRDGQNVVLYNSIIKNL